MKYIYLFLLLFSLQSHAETGTDCATPDVRCSAYDLDVNAEVLQNISFTQIQALNLGQSTKGEYIVVTTDLNQERGKKPGVVKIFGSILNTDGVTFRCLKDLSGVNFKGTTEFTNFSTCLLYFDGPAGASEITVQQHDTALAKLEVGLDVIVAGTITVPSDATSGIKSGSMRIEVIYE